MSSTLSASKWSPSVEQAKMTSYLAMFVDLCGTWVTTGDKVVNCADFAIGVAEYGGKDIEMIRKNLCSANTKIYQHIWKDFLELTITGVSTHTYTNTHTHKSTHIHTLTHSHTHTYTHPHTQVTPFYITWCSTEAT